LKRCKECGLARCCDDDCPKCGGEMIDERDLKDKKGCSVGTQ